MKKKSALLTGAGFAFLLTLFLPSAGRADYRIESKGGGTFLATKKPVLKGAAYIFTKSDGTVMSVRKSDVVSIQKAVPPKPEQLAKPLGSTSPVLAADEQKAINKEIAKGGADKYKGNLLLDKNLKGDFKSDSYTPGVGMGLPSGTNDLQIGRTVAAPPSGKVLEGAPPTGVQSGAPPTTQESQPATPHSN